jgi:hypothetical protein
MRFPFPGMGNNTAVDRSRFQGGWDELKSEGKSKKAEPTCFAFLLLPFAV